MGGANSGATRVGTMVISDAELKQAMKARAEGANYTGAGDNLLDFGRASSFIDEARSGKTFSMALKNEGVNDIFVAICPGYFTDPADIKTAAGVPADAIIKDGVIVIDAGQPTEKTLRVTGSPRPASTLLGYVQNIPSRLVGISVRVSDSAQLDEPLILRSETPFEVASEVQVIPSDFQLSADSNENLVRLDNLGDWTLSSQNILLYKVRAGKTATLSMVFGASLNIVKGVNNKAEEARLNVAGAFLRQSANP